MVVAGAGAGSLEVGGGADSVEVVVLGAGAGSLEVVVDGGGEEVVDVEVEPAPSCIHHPPLSLIQ